MRPLRRFLVALLLVAVASMVYPVGTAPSIAATTRSTVFNDYRSVNPAVLRVKPQSVCETGKPCCDGLPVSILLGAVAMPNDCGYVVFRRPTCPQKQATPATAPIYLNVVEDDANYSMDLKYNGAYNSYTLTYSVGYNNNGAAVYTYAQVASNVAQIGSSGVIKVAFPTYADSDSSWNGTSDAVQEQSGSANSSGSTTTHC